MTKINQFVDVNSFYFAKGMRTMPRAITYGGDYITFTDGLRLRVGNALQLFEMSATNGSVYRLSQQGSNWTLVGVTA